MWCEEMTHWKRPWCWERLKAGEEGDDRGWDGWMASSTWWMWVWRSSGSWWWTGRPGVLQSRGSQRVRHDWVTELTDWLVMYVVCRFINMFCILSLTVPWEQVFLLPGKVPYTELMLDESLWLMSVGWYSSTEHSSFVKYPFLPQTLFFPCRRLSVSNFCVTLCDPVDCSTPGSPVLRHLPEFAHVHVHWVGDTSLASSSAAPISFCLQSFPASGSFPMSRLSLQAAVCVWNSFPGVSGFSWQSRVAGVLRAFSSGPRCLHCDLPALLGQVRLVFVVSSTDWLKPWWKEGLFRKWNPPPERCVTKSPILMLGSQGFVLGNFPTSLVCFSTGLSIVLQWPALATLQFFNPAIFLPSRHLPLLSSNSFHVIVYLCQPALTLCAPLAIRHDTKQGRSSSYQCDVFFYHLNWPSVSRSIPRRHCQ